MIDPPETIPLLQVHQSYDKNLVTLIGIVAIEASWMDSLLGKTLAILDGQELDMAANPMFAQDAREKYKSLLKLDLEDWLRQALEDVPAILDERNLLIHGVHFTHTHPGQFVALRGKLKGGFHQTTSDRAQSLLKRIAYVNGAMTLISERAGLTIVN